jgi:hypothetical protein
MSANSVPRFHGQEEMFHQWWSRFQSFATVHKFLPAVGKDPEDDLPESSTVGENETKDQRKARKRNNVAITWLNIALEDDAHWF